MCCGDNNNKKDRECCLYDLLKDILKLQNRDYDDCCVDGCDKPFLGPNLSTICYNTRPLSFYNCTTGNLWNIQYTLNGTTSTSDVFRIEKLDECCCTCRVLVANTDGTYIPTNQFFTIDLDCISAVQCHPDVSLDVC